MKYQNHGISPKNRVNAIGKSDSEHLKCGQELGH